MATKSKIPSKAMQKRIMKTGVVTDDDVEQYIKQVGMDTLHGMSLSPENLKEYLKNITELGNPAPKKKLPSKKKVDSSDSILVVDSSDRVSKVSAEEAALTTQSRAKKATEGLIGLGASVFNRTFPTLGRFMSYVQTAFEKQDKKTKDTDVAVEGYSRQVGRSSVLLSNIVEAQEKTNQILNQMLSVVGSRNMTSAQPVAPGPENSNRSGQNQPESNQRTQGSAINPAAAAAALVAAGATGAAVGAGASALMAPSTSTTPNAQTSGTTATNPAPVSSTASATIVRNPTPPVATAISNPSATTTTRSNPASSNPPVAMPNSSDQQASGSDIRLLNFKAREIVFKADKFEYPQSAITSAGVAGGSVASPIQMPSAAATSSGGGTSSGSTPASAANLSGLSFEDGVDQRIKPGIANKTKEVQTAFGRRLLISSGFRDQGRNTRAGGAESSEHLNGNAVDIKFQGNEQETIELIRTASAKGIGGIGVYRPGFLHLDTGSKRVWGPNYKPDSIPAFAQQALNEHMGGSSSGGGGSSGGGSPGASAQQQTTSRLTPVASPVPSMPSSGAAVARASTADEASTRPSAAAPIVQQNSSTAAISNAPQQPSSTSIDPNNPGDVEPADAAQRYAKLFGMAA